MKGKRIWLALPLAVTLTVSGCSRGGETPPPVTAVPAATPVQSEMRQAEDRAFALPCSPDAGFHPILGNNGLNLTFAPLIYQGLFALDDSFAPVKDLCAKSQVSEDGLTWEFQLADAVFSDGSPLTAQEVVESLNTARESERFAGRLALIETVEQTETGSVIVTLSRPNGALPALLDVPIVKETEDGDRPLGTGEYVLSGEGAGLKLSARPEVKTPLPEIPLKAVEEWDKLVYAFDAKEIALVDTDLTGTEALGYSARSETTDYPTTTLLYIGCNTAKGSCRDQVVRQAAARAVDREDITLRLLAGHAVAAELPVHPNAKEYNAALAGKGSYDPQAAAEILAGAGWQAGEEGTLTLGQRTLELRLLVNQENTFKVAAAQRVVQELEGLGCAVTLEKLPWDQFTKALEDGEFDLYMGEAALTADFDLGAFLEKEGGLNYGGFQDEAIEALLEQYRAATGRNRMTTFVNLWGATAEQVPFIPVCFKNGSVLTQWGQVAGLHPAPRNVFAHMETWTVGQE